MPARGDVPPRVGPAPGIRLVFWLAAAAAASVHVLLVLSIVSQSLDRHVPPLTPRNLTWPLHYDSVNAPGPGADFFAVYHAGVQSRRGQSPYSLTEAPEVTPYYFRYRYLPIVGATVGRALTSLTPASAYRAWVLVLEGLLAALVVGLVRAQRLRRWQLFTACVLLLNAPYLLELHMGQFTYAAVALVCLAALVTPPAAAVPPGRTMAAVVLLSAAALLKIFPLTTLPAFLGTRRTRAIGIAVAAVFALGSVGELASPALHLNAFDDGTGLHPGNHSLLFAVFTASTALGVRWSPGAWSAVAIGAGVLVLGGTIVFLWRTGSRDLRLNVSALLLATLLGYFQVWEHHYTVAIVAGLLLAVALASRHEWPSDSQAVCAAALLVLAAPSPFALFPSRLADWSPAQALMLPLSKVVPTVLLLLVALNAARPSAAHDAGR